MDLIDKVKKLWKESSIVDKVVVRELAVADPAKWILEYRSAHPADYACQNDQDCVGVQADCISGCRGDAINSKGYSDYVVEYSKACAGAGRVVINCPATEKFCDNGSCRIRYI